LVPVGDDCGHVELIDQRIEAVGRGFQVRLHAVAATGQLVEILRALDVQLQRPRQRVEDLLGRILVATLLQPQVILRADPGQYGQLLASQAPNTPARTGNQSDVFGSHLCAPGAQVVTERVALCGHPTSVKLFLPIPGLMRFPLPGQQLEPPTRLLERVYGLTNAEADVASRVLRGDGLKPICEELSLSMATVKTHLQHVLDKTDTHRQAELVRLLLTIVP
jgi:DNA-binding CsgD family transcriptional regulator